MSSIVPKGKAEITVIGDAVVLNFDGIEERYSVTALPENNSRLVILATKDVLQGLDLGTVLTDLDRAGDLMYLAFCGVQGTDIAPKISNRQKDLAELCVECNLSMIELRDGSNDVLGYLLDAYKWLFKGNESLAIKKLSHCAAAANNMSSKCGDLAGKFAVLRDVTRGDSEETQKAVVAQVKLQAQLKEANNAMQAKQAIMKVHQIEAKRQIDELNLEISEEKLKEQKAANRSFSAQITGLVFGAIGAGLGAVVAVYNPLGSAVDSSVKQRAAEGVSAEEKANLDVASEANRTAEANQRDGDAKVAENKIAAQAKQKAQLLASQEMTTKKALLDKANAGTDLAAIEQAQADYDAATKALSVVNLELEQAKSDLKGSEDNSEAMKVAAAATAASLLKLQDELSKIADDATQKAQKAESRRISLIQQKREFETKNTEALATLAELTVKLDANVNSEEVSESSQAALEMAAFAFDNIYVALLNAKMFWEGMERFCKRLAEPKLMTDIKDVSEIEEKEDRIAYYQDADFMLTAVDYLVRWTALAGICTQYVEEANNARIKVTDNIKKSPSIQEARDQIGTLKANMTKRLNDEQKQSKNRLADLDKLLLEPAQ
jgi:hypothetical protein